MNFLSPLFLAALPLVAIPVAIHLLNRRQQKRIAWGAMRFLVQAATRKRRLWRLTDLLLLLLRTAAFLLFILALSRPMLPAAWIGGSPPREIILVLDPSLSTSREIGGITLFESQRQRINTLLEGLHRNDTVRVLLAGETPEWLNPDALPATPATLRTLRSQLEALRPNLGAGDLLACIREATDLEVPKDKAARVICVVSDGQRYGWHLDERARWAAVESRLLHAALPTTISIEFPPGDPPTSNVAVNRLESARAFGALDQPLIFTATVENYGPDASPASLLSWRIDDQDSGVSTVPELKPGASTTLTLNHAFGSAGTFDVSCQLEVTDELPKDNDAHWFVQIYERLPVLLAEDADSAEPLEKDAPFVLAALGASPPEGQRRWHSVFEPKVTDSTALGSMDLSPYRCLILANVGSLPTETLARLEAYVRDGGGLWLVLGSHSDQQTFNNQWYRGGLGLSPMKLLAPVGDSHDRENYTSVRVASEAHPATALLADVQRLDLDRVQVFRRHSLDATSGKDVSILIQAQGGEPVVVERKFGRGRVLVQSIPLGVEWSTLPLSQAYVAMLHEWMWYLSEPNLPKRNLAVGEVLIETASKSSPMAELTLPGGRTIALAVASSPAGVQFRYPDTREPGIYALKINPGSSAELTPKFQVQRNPQESDLAGLTEPDRQQFAAMKEFRLGTGLGNAVQGTDEIVPRRPLEGWLLAALPCVLLGEIAMAGWTTHRRQNRSQPVTMGG